MYAHIHPHDPAPHTRGRTIHHARLYDLVATRLLRALIAKLRVQTLDRAALQAGDTVLDVGCGTGDLCLRATDRVGATGSVYGIDAAPEMIAVARRKVMQARRNVDLRVGTVEALPFEGGTFDVVLSSLMMHHLPPDLKQQALPEIRRVLKSTGRLVVVDFKRPTTATTRLLAALLLHGAMPEGVQDLPELLHQHGFRSIQTGTMMLPMLGYMVGWAGKS